MANSTVQQTLANANPTNVADAVKLAKLAEVLAGLIPRKAARSGLASSATQVHNVAGLVTIVEATAGVPLAMVTGGTVGAGEVSVNYDAEGVPTFVFGDGAVTGYTVTQIVLPTGYATTLASASGTF